MDALIEFEILFTAFWQNLGAWLEYPMQAFTFLGSELFFLLVMPALYWSIDPVIGFRAGMMLILSGGLNSVFKMLFRTPRPLGRYRCKSLLVRNIIWTAFRALTELSRHLGNHRCDNPRKMGIHRRDPTSLLYWSLAHISWGSLPARCTYRVAGWHPDHPGLPEIRDPNREVADWKITRCATPAVLPLWGVIHRFRDPCAGRQPVTGHCPRNGSIWHWLQGQSNRIRSTLKGSLPSPEWRSVSPPVMPCGVICTESTKSDAPP